MTEGRMLELARRGRGEARAALYAQHYGRVFRLARRYVRSAEDAEDVAQDTFIKAFGGLAAYDPGLGSGFQAWINRICVHCSIDFLRSAKRRKGGGQVSLEALPQEPASPAPTPEDIIIARGASSRVQEAVICLSPRQRAIFILRFREQMEIRQIALLLDCSEGNIRAHLFRSTHKLRDHFRPVDHPYRGCS